MPTTRTRRKETGNARQNDEQYAVVIAAEREGIDVVLRQLSARRAERIAAQKNRELGPNVAVHVVPEAQVE
ncbi:hypothetical protein [Haladaptatus sp. NG-WS-4]